MHRFMFTGSCALTVMLAISAYGGIGYPEWAYARESANWLVQSQAQDWLNLLVLAPLIMVSSVAAFLWSSARGFALWLGSMIATAYVFAIYSFSLHFGPLFPAHVTVLALSAVLLASGLDVASYSRKVIGVSTGMVRYFAAALMLLAAPLIALVWLTDIGRSLLAGTVPASTLAAGLPVNPVHVLDLAFYLPAMFAVGALLLLGTKWGEVLAAPMLTSMVLIGLSVSCTAYALTTAGLSGSSLSVWAIVSPPSVGALLLLSVLYRISSAPPIIKVQPTSGSVSPRLDRPGIR